MRKKLVINDLHIGARRSAGTTPQTAAALREHLLRQTEAILMRHTDKDVIINGDLFDAYDIFMGDALAFYFSVCRWMAASAKRNKERLEGSDPQMVLGQGNHDPEKDSTRLSIFGFVAALLAQQFPERIKVVTKAQELWPGFYMIPHCVNQDEFTIELEKAVYLPHPSYIFLHANWDNGFAAKEDHSLNVSPEQAEALTSKGHVLIFGHVHQAEHVGDVHVIGNQFPSSVADCMGNKNKVALIIDWDNQKMSYEQTWEEEGSFLRIDWREADTIIKQAEFIRVEGEATAEEAALVIAAVSKLRQKSTAFVVTNAVKIEGVAGMDEINVAAEEMKGVDVLNFLFENLEPEQVEVVKKLLEAA